MEGGRSTAGRYLMVGLAAADELSVHPLAGAEGVDVETVSRGRAEADDQLDLWTGNHDAGAVAVAVVREQRRQSGRGRRARRDAVAVSGAGLHGTSLIARATSRNHPGALVRFLQSVAARRWLCSDP